MRTSAHTHTHTHPHILYKQVRPLAVLASLRGAPRPAVKSSTIYLSLPVIAEKSDRHICGKEQDCGGGSGGGSRGGPVASFTRTISSHSSLQRHAPIPNRMQLVRISVLYLE